MKKVTLWFTLFALIVSITPVFTNATHRDDAQIIANRFDCPTTIEAEELIYSLYDAINEQNLNSLPGMFEPALQNEYAEFISNEENRKEHLGLFNIKNAHVCSLSLVDVSNACDYYSKSEFLAYTAIVNMKVFREAGYYTNGYNVITLVVGKCDGDPVFFEVSLDPYADVSVYLTYSGCSQCNIPLHVEKDYDTPYASTYAWSNPSTIRVRNYGTVDFKTYCKVVMAGEVNYSDFTANAFRSCAMAIKNYGWMRIMRKKYPDLNYDVREDTNDQVYDPSKTRLSAADSAVDYIWPYMMLDSTFRLFPGFHVHDSSVHSHACKGGGVLSQMGSKSLAASGNSWEYILHYYYDYDGSFARTDRNEQMSRGAIKIIYINHSVTGTSGYLQHTPTQHKRKCSTCNCYHTSAHELVYNPNANNYQCSKCGYATVPLTKSQKRMEMY